MAVMRKEGEWKPQKKPSLDKLSPILHRMELTRFGGEGKDVSPRVEIDYDTAISYLRREAIRLPEDAPRGIVTLTYRGAVIGQGRHEALLENCPGYREIAQSQMGGAILD